MAMDSEFPVFMCKRLARDLKSQRWAAEITDRDKPSHRLEISGIKDGDIGFIETCPIMLRRVGATIEVWVYPPNQDGGYPLDGVLVHLPDKQA